MSKHLYFAIIFLESRKGKQHRNLFNTQLKLRKERLQKLRKNKVQNGRSRIAKRLKELRQHRLSKQNNLFDNNELNLDTYDRENNKENDAPSSRKTNTIDARIVETNEQRNIPQSFNTFDDQRPDSEDSRKQFETSFSNKNVLNNFNFNKETPQTSSPTNVLPDESDYLFSDYDNSFNGNDYLNFEDDYDEQNDFSDSFLDDMPQKSINENENRNGNGIFIKEPNFAIDKTEVFDRDQKQQRSKSRNKTGTNLLEPNFSIDQDDRDDSFRGISSQFDTSTSRGRGGEDLLEPDFSIDQDERDDSFRGSSSQFDKSTSRQRGEEDLLEPDFALDYDIELPDSSGSFDKSKGIDIAEPDFAIDDGEDSNKTLNRKKSLPEGIIGNSFTS